MNQPKCHTEAQADHPVEEFQLLDQGLLVFTLRTLNQFDHATTTAPFQFHEAQPAPPIPDISIVPPVIENRPLHLMTATHPFVSGQEKFSVPPVIVMDE